MTREEFEREYASRHMKLSFMHNQIAAIDDVKANRADDGYADPHIDLCWKVQKIQDSVTGILFVDDLMNSLDALEW